MSGSKNNIKFNYLYRDVGNYKVWGDEVFSNPDFLTLASVQEKIIQSLIDGEFFDPEHWQVKRLKHDDWVPGLDHAWNEFVSVEFTEEDSTIDFSITEFLDMIVSVPKY